MRGGVLVVGGANLDLIAVAGRLPARGETVIAHAYRESAGGKAANLACAAAAWGAPVSFVGRIGDDSFGDSLVRAWLEVGVDTTYVRRDPAGTGLGMVLMDERGDYQTLVVPRANGRLSPDDVAALPESVWNDVRLVALALEAPIDAMIAVADAAVDHGLPLVLNAAPAEGMVDELWPAVSYVVVNEYEAGLLTGLDVADPKCAGTAGAALSARLSVGRGKAAIVTLGALGAVVVSVDGTARHVPAPSVEVVDSLGAGDTFVGVLAAEIAADSELTRAVDAACRAGAAAVTVYGARASVTRDRADDLGEGASPSPAERPSTKGVQA